MHRKPLETSYDVDPDRYQLTEALKVRIIRAFSGILAPNELTLKDFDIVIGLLNEVHSYWFHCEYYAPPASEVIDVIKKIETRAEALLQLLDISLNPPRPPKSGLRHPNYASLARRALRARASSPAPLTPADTERIRAKKERQKRKIVRITRAHELALKIFERALSSPTVTEADIEYSAPASLDGLRNILSISLNLHKEIVQEVDNAPRTRHYLEPIISGVAERIFKPHKLSQSYITRGIKRISRVAIVARKLSQLLDIDAVPPSLATVTELHKKLYPGWRPPTEND
jgi:hypothetical protein